MFEFVMPQERLQRADVAVANADNTNFSFFNLVFASITVDVYIIDDLARRGHDQWSFLTYGLFHTW
jgi:hypothetical protein